jgi:branched-chain amino acid transport system permease protein
MNTDNKLRLVALVLALVLPWLLTDVWTLRFTMALTFALTLLGLNLLIGYCGVASLGHAGFMLLGAYAAAILVTRTSLGWTVAILGGGAVSGIVSLLFAYPIKRLDRTLLALTTMSFAAALPQLVRHPKLAIWTGGADGIVLDPLQVPEVVAKWGVGADTWYYYVVLLCLVLGYALLVHLLNNRTGRAIQAVREHPISAASMGINVNATKIFVFGLSAIYAGVAGGLFAMQIQFVSADSFSLFDSMILAVGIVVGGLASLGGAVIGAFFIRFVPTAAGAVSTAAPWAVFGIAIALTVYFLPRGIVGGMRAWAARFTR